jgi:hypothetical protein
MCRKDQDLKQQVFTSMMLWIRFLCFFETLAYHVNLTHAFQDGIPIWGAGKKKVAIAMAEIKSQK